MEITSMESFLSYFEGIRARTKRVIACIPPDKIDWSYREGKFSFGDVIRHLGASERYMFAENARLRPSRYHGCGRELADGFDASVAFLDQMHEESVAIFREVGDEGLTTRCTTPGGADISVAKWLRAMIEHEVHHRGQIYLCLNLLDVETPPMFGLSAEEVEARSQPKE